MDFDTDHHRELRRQCAEKKHDWVRHMGAEPVIDGGLLTCKRCGKFVRSEEEARALDGT